MARSFVGNKKKEEVDPFAVICEKTDRLSALYTNDPYWKAMKAGCDAIRSGNIDDNVIAVVDKERRCWIGNSKDIEFLHKKLVGE